MNFRGSVSARLPRPAASIVKVGGSLFDLPDLRGRVESFLDGLGARAILVAGGGPFVDLVRHSAQEHDFDDAQAHWAAIDSMSQSARWLASRLELEVIERLPSMSSFQLGSGSVVLDVAAELRSHPAALPEGWHVTSDSIAAYFAHRIAGTEPGRLVLLKSVGGTADLTVMDAARRGWVDGHFPSISKGLDAQWINLRTQARCRLVDASEPAPLADTAE